MFFLDFSHGITHILKTEDEGAGGPNFFHILEKERKIYCILKKAKAS